MTTTSTSVCVNTVVEISNVVFGIPQRRQLDAVLYPPQRPVLQTKVIFSILGHAVREN
jgi:hypothetical protein